MKKIIPGLGFFLGLAFMALGLIIYHQDNAEIEDGYARQETEENIADEFVRICLESAEDTQETFAETGSPSENKTDTETERLVLPDTPNFILEDYSAYGDDTYYSLTPDYASGEFKFVLYIPDIGLKRGVYGSDDQSRINADLAIWMVVLMDARQELGKTNIAIAGHDSLSEDLSFNHLVDIETYNYIGEGHNIYLYSYEGVYIYEIAEVFDERRSTGRTKYGYTTDLSVTDLYIFTCGRDISQNPSQIADHRYKDLIVHGVLKEVLSWKEYRERIAQ